jgi:hypothetical protein
VYKKGKFSAIEEAQLKDAIENYRTVSQPYFSQLVKILMIVDMQAKGLSPEEMNDMIFAKNEKGGKDNAFWSEISQFCSFRSILQYSC